MDIVRQPVVLVFLIALADCQPSAGMVGAAEASRASPAGSDGAAQQIIAGRPTSSIAQSAPNVSASSAAPPAAAASARPIVESPVAGMASIAGGTFKMGVRGDTVSIRPFLLDITEVTADAYESCVRAGRCSAQGLRCGNGKYSTYGVRGKENHPINCVDWHQATAYCGWVEKRLPTEEEWEWVARGQANGWTYPWGDAAPVSQLCWNRWATKEGTCPVGSYPQGDAPGGIHDLAGSVWEWTATIEKWTFRIYRGGSWYFDDPLSVSAVNRIAEVPEDRYDMLGFRCAR